MNVVPERFVVIRALPIDHHSLITISKQTPPFSMPHIEAPRHRVLQPFHTLHQIRLGRLNEKMVMVFHQHPSVHKPTCFVTNISKALQKKPPVVIIHKNRRLPVPSSHHMVKSPFKFQSNTSRHGGTPTDENDTRKLKMKENEH